MSVVFTVALTLLVSYLLGCFNGSVMTSHFIIRDDVRQHGSGNAGLTNFYRTYGARYALCVIICDMGKTVLACLIGGYLMHWVAGDWTLGLLIAGIGCELGHMFPVFFGLRQGHPLRRRAGAAAGLAGGSDRLGPVCQPVAADPLCVSGLRGRHGQHAGIRVFPAGP